jgi:hypothetical protein
VKVAVFSTPLSAGSRSSSDSKSTPTATGASPGSARAGGATLGEAACGCGGSDEWRGAGGEGFAFPRGLTATKKPKANVVEVRRQTRRS